MQKLGSIGLVLLADEEEERGSRQGAESREEEAGAVPWSGRALAVVLMLFFGLSGFTTVRAATWMRELASGITPRAIVATSDGGYAVAGYTTAFGPWFDAVFVSKMNGSGTLQWQRTLGATNNEMAYALAQTSDGGYIVAGSSNSFQASHYWFVWVVRLDSMGAVVWQKYYNLGNNAQANGVIQTADGGFAVVGTAQLRYNGPYSALFFKLNADGSVQWEESFTDTGYSSFASVVQTADGGYAALGSDTGPSSAGGSDLWLVRLGPDGTVWWEENWGGPGNDVGACIITLSGGGFLLAGTRREASNTLSHPWLLEVDDEGTVKWQQRYEQSISSSESVVQVVPDGEGFLLAGHSYWPGDNIWDRALLLDVDGSGQVRWQRSFTAGTPFQSLDLYGVAPAPDGGFLAVGASDQFHSGCGGGIFLKLDGTGNLGNACLAETNTTFSSVTTSASTVTTSLPATARSGVPCQTSATDAAFTPEVKACDPLTIGPPSGLPSITAKDVDACADSGVLITWPVDPDDWGDESSGDRTYDVLRDGALLATCLPYGTYSYVDDQGTNNTTYAYAVRYSNGGDFTAETASVDAEDNVSFPAAPSAEKAVDVDPSRPSGVALSWSAPSDWNDSGKDPADRAFRIYRSDLSEPIKSLSADTTTYTDATGQVNPPFPYAYQVAAVNACGNEYRSDYIQAEDDASPPGDTSGPGHPMTASKAYSTSVSVSFTPTGCASGDTIYWGTWNAQFPGIYWSSSLCIPDASTSATFAPGDPAPGTFIYFVVVGNNKAAEGSYGRDSDGNERQTGPPSPDCSFPQDLSDGCPY